MSEKLMLTFLLAMLGICAFQDWRRREVSVTVLVLFGSIGLLFGVAVAQEPVAGRFSPGQYTGGSGGGHDASLFRREEK